MGSRAGLRKLIVKSRISIGDETIITNVFPLRPRKRDLFRENAVQLDPEHASETQRIMRPPREIRLDLLKTISKLGDAPEADSTGGELSRGLAGHFAQRNFALHLGEFSVLRGTTGHAVRNTINKRLETHADFSVYVRACALCRGNSAS